MRVAVDQGQGAVEGGLFADAPHQPVVAIAAAQKEQQLVGYEGTGEGAQHHVGQMQQMLVRQETGEHHHAFAFEERAAEYSP
ncbi:hypothetical protein G6F32_016771 [Rhizopus arrhizus]|nr:hypothetical protein G6F32_016771 [Rhizopus arrhizus]